MKKRHLVSCCSAALGLLALLVMSGPAHAQYYYPAHPMNPMHQPPLGYKHRVHPYIGGQVMVLAVLAQNLDGVGGLGHGGGFGLTGGIRLGRFFALEANWTFTLHDEIWNDEGETVVSPDSLQSQTITLDMKIHIPTWRRAEPFFQLGGGWAFFGGTGWEDPYYDPYTSYLYTSGPTFNLGGGMNFWLGPHFSVGGRILYRGMYFAKPDFELKRPHQQGYFPINDPNFVSGVSLDLFVMVHF